MRSSIWRVPGMGALAALTVAGFTGYAALLSVAPLWVARSGAGTAQAGLVNGVMLVATVLAQGGVPAALRRFGWAPVLVAGLVLLGPPSLALGFSAALPAVLAASAVRGLGFAVLTVCGSAAVALLTDPARRGRGIGAYGLAVAVPNVLALPLGPYLAEHVGFAAAFALGAAPLLGIGAAWPLGQRVEQRRHEREHGAGSEPPHPRAGASTAEVLRALTPSAVVLLSVTLVGGGLLTFVPQLVADPGAAAAALAAMGVIAAGARWLVGGVADARGPGPLIVPLSLVTVVSAALAAWAVALPDPDQRGWWVVAACALFAIPYGALQSLTLVTSFAAVPGHRVGLASATWNVGFDLGTALGSVTVGAMAAAASFSAALWVLVGAVAAVVPVAARLARR